MSEVKFIISLDSRAFKSGSEEVKAQVRRITEEVKVEGGKMQREFDSIGKSMGSSMGKYLAAFGGAAVFKQLIGDMVRVRGEFQKADTAIRTMLGSKEKADELMSQVRDYAKISPLEFGDITKATQMMISFNIEATKVPQFIKAIGDVSMGEKDRFNSLALAFSQMSATGKLMGQDLLQMINAGFNPLATMAEKTGKSIGELKEEMSKGAISAEMVQQAFIDATSAGGKFFGMSENAAKTINGQLSMLSDAIDSAFNELGTKSEGIISGAIKGVTKIVENYETIGKVVLQLVQIYGTYKAALLVNEAILIRKTAIELAAAKGVTVMQLATDLLRKKMEALNLTMLKNPYVLVTSLVITAATAFALWSKNADEMAKATEKLNDAFADTQAKIQEEQANIDNLFGKLRKAKEGTSEWKQVKDEIISQYGQYLAGLDAEIVSLRDVEGAYKAVARAAREAAIAEGKAAALKTIRQDYGKAYGTNLEGLRETLKDYKVSEKEIGSLMTQIQKDLSASGKITDATQKRILSHLGNYENVWNVRAKAFIENLNKNEKSLTDAAALVEERFQTFDEGGGSGSGKSRGRGKKEIQADIDAAQAELDGLTKQEALGKKGLALKKKISSLRKEMDAYDVPSGKGGARGGRTTTSSKKDTAQEEAEQRARIIQFTREFAEQRDSEERKANDALENARLAAIKDNAKRELAAEELEHKRRLREIRAQGDEFAKQEYENKKKAWELTHKKGVFEETEEGKAGWEAIMLTPDQQKLIAAQVDEEESRWESFLESRADKEKSAMNEYLRNYGTYQERRLAITEDFDNQIDQALYEGDKKALEAQKQAALDQLDRDFGLKTQQMADLFEDASQKSVKAIDTIIKKYEALIKFMKGSKGETKVVTLDDLHNLGFTDDDIKKAQTGVIKINDIIEAVKNLRKEVEGKSPLRAFTDDIDKAVAKIKDGKLVEGLDNISQAIAKFIPSIKGLTTSIASAFGGSNNDTEGILGIIQAIPDLVTGMVETVQGDTATGLEKVAQSLLAITESVKKMKDEEPEFADWERLKDITESLVSVWDDLIEKKKEYLSLSVGGDTLRTEKEIKELIENETEAWRELGEERLRAGASATHHSIGYRIMRDMSNEAMEAASKALGGNARDILGKTASGLFDLTTEQLQKLKEEAPQFWARLDKDVQEYLNNIIEGAERLEEVQKSVKEQLTRTTFDDVKSNFISQLADMESAASDFSDDFSQMLFQAMLNTKFDELFNDRLDTWYEHFANSMKDSEISDSERNALLAEWDGIVADSMALRDNLADVTGYAKSMGEGGGAYKAAQSFSQEQGDELNGRLTSIQIGQAYQNEQLTMAVTALQGLSVVASASGTALNEMRNLLLIGNGHLEDIARYTRIAAQYGDAINTIADKIKTL